MEFGDVVRRRRMVRHLTSRPDKVRSDGGAIAWPVPYWFLDVGCSLMVLLLAAVDAGLAAGFAGFPEGRIEGARELLSLPGEVLPIGVVAVGHPAPDLRSPSLRRPQRPVWEVVHRERW
jgi:nitroreductase